MKPSIVCSTGLVLLACASTQFAYTFSVGDVIVSVSDEAQLPADFAESIDAMRTGTATIAPAGLWNFKVRVVPQGVNIWRPGDGCYYQHEIPEIVMRADQIPICFPHEVAHRWLYLSSGESAGRSHDSVHAALTEKLSTYMRKTWLWEN